MTKTLHGHVFFYFKATVCHWKTVFHQQGAVVKLQLPPQPPLNRSNQMLSSELEKI